MQRLAGDFFVKRTATRFLTKGGSQELYELPNGQWQFGKGENATVVRSIEQVEGFPDEIMKDVGAWLERIKHAPSPMAVQQGRTPMIAGGNVKDKLGRAISLMPDEVAARLLNAFEQVLGPVADSLTQEIEVNSHADGFGQDQGFPSPGSVEERGFKLPAGSKWVNPSNQASGYLSPIPGLFDDHNIPMMAWHPTPEFHRMTTQPDPIPIAETTPMPSFDDSQAEALEEELSRERELVGADRGKRNKRR